MNNRAKARRLINAHLNQKYGLSIDDLADDYAMGELIDTVEDMLDNNETAMARDTIHETATQEWLRENILG